MAKAVSRVTSCPRGMCYLRSISYDQMLLNCNGTVESLVWLRVEIISTRMSRFNLAIFCLCCFDSEPRWMNASELVACLQTKFKHIKLWAAYYVSFCRLKLTSCDWNVLPGDPWQRQWYHNCWAWNHKGSESGRGCSGISPSRMECIYGQVFMKTGKGCSKGWAKLCSESKSIPSGAISWRILKHMQLISHALFLCAFLRLSFQICRVYKVPR